ncbi:unnamed protein product, partial [Mesorhabditis belari]|uniref:Uncharacterized protein n=1 Tax=Mesorhabditis belari TaxID=2138241 RepID=A0AAF3J886_9BILA
MVNALADRCAEA